MTLMKGLAAVAGFAVAVIVVARLVFALPAIVDRMDSAALIAPDGSLLVSAVSRQRKDHPGKTGVAPLDSGSDAFAARMILADAADSSIDALYYTSRRSR